MIVKKMFAGAVLVTAYFVVWNVCGAALLLLIREMGLGYADWDIFLAVALLIGSLAAVSWAVGVLYDESNRPRG